MPATNTPDETTTSYPPQVLIDVDTPSTRTRTSQPTGPVNVQQPEGRSTTHRPPRNSQDVKPHVGERESKKPQPDLNSHPLLGDVDTPHTRIRTSQPTGPVNVQQPEGRSTTNRPPRNPQDVKPHVGERESKKPQPDLPDAPSVIIDTATTTTKQRSPQSPIDQPDERSGVNTHTETTSDSDSSTSLLEGYDDLGVPSDDPKEGGEWSSYPKGPPTTSTAGGKPIRVGLTQASVQAQAHAATYPQAIGGRPPNIQVVPGHLPEEEQQEMVEHRQPNQGGNYSQGVMETIRSFMPTVVASPQPPKDRYQILKEDFRQLQYDLKRTNMYLEGYKQELRRTRTELRNTSHYANELHHEKQRWKDQMNGLQNELNNIHQQLNDAKNLSDVRGKELHGAQVFLTKADTLSISEVGEKVTALNEEIFQAAATLGEALIHQRHELPLEDLNAAAAEAQQMVGSTISNILITQGQKPEPEVNPLLVQVVLQVFMVKFCASKIQSWYPSDAVIEGFLNAIYSGIRLSEEQAVSGRWRALTRTHTRPTTDKWTDELFEKLMSVLKIASWMPGSPDNQESFRHRLPPIFKAVNELRMAIGEKFTSADLDVCTHDCGTGYVPSYMEDGYGDSRQQQSNDKRLPEIVAGTTGIGLMKFMVERGANDALRLESVISAKIVLESTLKEALEPAQTSGRRLKKPKKPVENTDGAADQEGRKSKPT